MPMCYNCGMDSKCYIKLLKRAGIKLQELRDDELRKVGHPREAIEALSDSFEFAIRSQSPSITSGLVEFQRLVSGLVK